MAGLLSTWFNAHLLCPDLSDHHSLTATKHSLDDQLLESFDDTFCVVNQRCCNSEIKFTLSSVRICFGEL